MVAQAKKFCLYYMSLKVNTDLKVNLKGREFLMVNLKVNIKIQFILN